MASAPTIYTSWRVLYEVATEQQRARMRRQLATRHGRIVPPGRDLHVNPTTLAVSLVSTRGHRSLAFTERALRSPRARRGPG